MSTDNLEHLFSSRDPATLDLTIGAPGPEILTKLPAMFQTGTAARMDQEAGAGNLFQYGPEQGLVSYRTSLAKFLESEYKDPVDPDTLVLTTGATNGLFVTCSLLLDRQAVIFVENPTYFIALEILVKDLGFKVVSIPMTSEGIDWKTLEMKVGEEKSAFKGDPDRFWAMLYIIPNYHNPTGISYTTSTCTQILRICRENNLLAFCDDVYNLLKYNQQTSHYSRLKALDTTGDGFVISNGTFSKILAPGLRLGWLELPRRLVAAYTGSGLLLSGGSQNNYTSGVVTALLQAGTIQRNLTFLKDLYGGRMREMTAYLKAHLPPSWRVSPPDGGYFLWIEADRDLAAFCENLKTECSLVVLPGRRTCPLTYLGQEDEGGNLGHCMRISVAYYPLERLLEGCRVLCLKSEQLTKL